MSLRTGSLLLLAALLPAAAPSHPFSPPKVAPARMTPASTAEQLYTVLIFERPADLAARTDSKGADAYWTSYDEYAAALMKAGALRGGSALDERVARTVRGTGSADRGVPASRLGGYFVIAAPSLDAAEALAKLAPARAVAVELRPHRDNPHAAAMAR
jgi:hypothetical protein